MINSPFLQMPHKADFTYYLSHINTRNKKSIHPFITEKLKGLHKKIYYLNLLIQSLEVSDKEHTYLQEITVDLITSMDLFSLNYIKSVRMSLRAAIEEFNRLLLVNIKGELGKISVYQLNQQVKDHFQSNTVIKDKVSQMLSDYKDLCDFVHVSGKKAFTEKLVLEDFQIIDKSELDRVCNQIFRVIENIIFIVICVYKEAFLKLNKHKQSYILGQMKDLYQKDIEGILEK
ncbi:hypothetical protein NQ109_28590 [Priestia megaterium]|uniref:hypothetical protein n=1 Tax=Priestia megaterium TaxID=1404 RepID=UPI00215B2CFC|nr:hypothetical protein [Priestia megaterium]MCR8866888.1 hypothetical protein [Priestia megaterium]